MLYATQDKLTNFIHKHMKYAMLIEDISKENYHSTPFTQAALVNSGVLISYGYDDLNLGKGTHYIQTTAIDYDEQDESITLTSKDGEKLMIIEAGYYQLKAIKSAYPIDDNDPEKVAFAQRHLELFKGFVKEFKK